MVEYQTATGPAAARRLDSVFTALGDPTRRAILARLRRGDATVGDLAQPFAVSLNAVSKHLKVLERAGLVRRRRTGREHWLSLDAAPLTNAAKWIVDYQDFWNTKLDRMDALLRRRANT